MLTKQELCGRITRQDVIYCVSSLIDGIVEASRTMHYKQFEDAFNISPDDILDLLQKRDFEEPGTMFIRGDAEIAELQEIADHFGDWGDLLDKAVPQVVEDAEGVFSFAPFEEHFDDEDEAREAAVESVLKQLRKAVVNLVADWNWIGENYDIEPDYQDCYEHWIVSQWLARRLQERGEVVVEVAGVTVWGRTASGQSISCDYVIEQIAKNTWPEEWEQAK